MSDVPSFLTHYAVGPPFRSMMDLDDAGRQRVLDQDLVTGPARWADPTYWSTRRRVEAMLYDLFVAGGGKPHRRHPHYALVGHSERERSAQAYSIPLERLPEAQVSFTWGDSFHFDEAFRRATGHDHPAGLQVYRLSQLHDILRLWPGATRTRPGWKEVELQLWFDPEPELAEPRQSSSRTSRKPST